MTDEALPEDRFEITIEQSGGETIVTINGEVDVRTSPMLRETLEHQQDAEVLVFDVTEMSFIDSSGLGVLVAAVKKPDQSSRKIIVRGPTEPVRRMFEITGLQSLFEIESLQTD